VILTEQAATFNMFQAGAIDWTNNNSIDTALVPSLRGREDFHLNPTLGTYMSVFNVTKKPFNDARVRRAFALVVDQALITDKILRSGFQPTHRLVPPVIPGYQSQVPDQPAFDVRLAEAKKLLSEAGYPEGKGFPAVTYKYNTDEQHHKIAQALQAAWQKHLGVSVKLENLEWKVFLSEQKRRNFDVARLGWIGDYPDPATFLELYMTGNENNRSGWSNPQYDELVRSALREQDEKKRFGLYAQAEKIVADEAPMIGIYHYSYFSLINPAVQGFIPNPHGHHLFRFLSKK
jgi:oligopeptide transport system substrate-binding protein